MAARALAAVVAALLLEGCAVAHVVTNEPGATILFDGRPIAKDGRIWSTGPPHTGRILVMAKDGRRARYVVDREFSPVTLSAGLYTMGVCFVLCWTYPQEILVPLPPPRRAVAWDADPSDDPWGTAADASPWSAPPSTPGATP